MKMIQTMMVLVLMAGIASAGSLDAMKSAYTNADSKIACESQKQKDEALSQYGRNLVIVLATIKQKGDIDGYGIVEQEVKRFQADKMVLTNVPVLLTDAVNAYQKQAKAVDQDTNHRKVDLMKRYIAALGGLVKNMMAADNIADAKAVGDEKKDMEFMLAELESGMSKGQPQEVKEASLPAVPVESVVTTNWQYLCDIKELSIKVGGEQFHKGKEMAAAGWKFDDNVIEHGMYAIPTSAIEYNLSQYHFKHLRGRAIMLGSGKGLFIIKGPGGKILWKSPEATQLAIKAEPEKFSFDLEIKGMGPLILVTEAYKGDRSNCNTAWMDIQVAK